jgi:hypothetical protein
MLSKKDDSKLVDLEYMIPKEHKEEAERKPEPEAEQTTLNVREVCYACGKDSEEIVLLPVFHQGSDKWICPKCLKGHFDTAYGYSDSYGYGSSQESSDTPSPTGSSTESSPSDSPMSMFD